MNKNKNMGLKKKLEDLAFSVLNHDVHGYEIKMLSDKFGFSRGDLVDTVLNYTMRGGDFENEEYRDILMRATLHLHNEVSGTYHKKKENFVASALKYNNSLSVADIGYGVVSNYVFDSVSRGLEVCLLDQDKEAENFSRELFRLRCIRDKKVSYGVHDMNSFEYVGDFDSYVMLDSIEHCRNPTRYLKQLVGNSRDDSKFIFSIPLMRNYGEDGTKELSFHYIEWLTSKNAVEWLESANLNVLQSKTIIPNLEVDFFAYMNNSSKPSYKCFMVNCEKVKGGIDNEKRWRRGLWCL